MKTIAAAFLCITAFVGSYLALAFDQPLKSIPASAHDPKVESALEELTQADANTMAEVIIEPQGGSVARVDKESLEGVGARLEAESQSLIRARVPLAQLKPLAKVSGVRFVRRPYRLTPLAVSEGVVATGAALFHANRFKGQGVKIAIIDVGFSGLTHSINKKEISKESIIHTRDFTGEGLETGSNHGTAVAEIIHEMAPKAGLILLKIKDEVDLENAVDDAIAQGASIINHSVGWVNTNFGDGTGFIDRLADRARAYNILWINAAGNHAQQHWEGAFRDQDGDGWHEFKAGDENLYIKAPIGGLIQVFLTWDDWPASDKDFDLYLFDNRENLLASSTNHQRGSEPPTEEIEFFAPQPGVYRLKIFARGRWQGMPLEIFSFNHTLDPAVAEGSIMAPADSENVLAVTAIDYKNWETGPQEPFSSQGPTSDGRIKPDLSAPDGVTNFTSPRFRGTSASAPHVAAAAALLLSQQPHLSVQQLQMLLEQDAVDLGQPGKDNVYGAGRLELSLGQPFAQRTIDTLVLADSLPRAFVGETFTVSVSVKMPRGSFGGLEFVEALPEGFSIAPLDNAGARFERQGRGLIRWSWPLLAPGTFKKITYKIMISERLKPGIYTLKGTINGVPSEAAVEVIERLSIEEAVAHWNSRLQKIDPTQNGHIREEQIQQAILWWVNDTEVPGAFERLSLRKLQWLVAHYLSGTSIKKQLPQRRLTQTEPGATVSRVIEGQAGPGGSLLVALHIRAHEELLGLALEEQWPAGWEIKNLESSGAVFKASTAQWLFPQRIREGEELLIQYRVDVPWGEVPGARHVLSGTVSSASPSFSTQIDSTAIVTLGEREGLSLTRIVGPPNPLRKETGIFNVEGSAIESLKLELFNLAGKKVFEGEAQGKSFIFNALNAQGHPLANGVYFYVLTVRGFDSKIIKSEMRRLVILR